MSIKVTAIFRPDTVKIYKEVNKKKLKFDNQGKNYES